MATLHHLRSLSSGVDTVGLSDEVIAKFCGMNSHLVSAIEQAMLRYNELTEEFGADAMKHTESDMSEWLQSDYINFYAPATVNPYIALAAQGPWIVTVHGAVLHDNGGYGMLGSGHGPSDVIGSMSKNVVMANIMTPSFSQKRLAKRLQKELGYSRGSCPFTKFICMNSGSESVTVSLRIADVNAQKHTGPGGRHEGKPIKLMAVERAFHGRTDRPAQISHSCMSAYEKNLATFQNRDNLILVPANNVSALESAFQKAEDEGYFIELMAIEPVQGEGNPGSCIERSFYDAARKLTLEHGSMLLVDSIQAGIRGQGCLSIIDYEGFQDAECPDLETWSKALNAGQYPLSVLGLNDRASENYVVGIYGNTMTTNPRALETACTVLENITPELRQNIRDRGDEFVEKLVELSHEFPEVITKVQGTGLLLSAELEPTKYPVIGFDAVETWCRKNGLGVIHGGLNALRFTPHFGITSEEIDLIIDIVRASFIEFSS
ncbi:MAG: lysine 6-aminotransferase [Euryarchaeota archaeon]|nr:lysine 6-aminotransferase [Euryarchaeota archaeon]